MSADGALVSGPHLPVGAGGGRGGRGGDRARGRIRELVTFDVGGTSTDVSLVWRGEPLFTSNRAVADYPVKTPMVDIHVIGAGGGSIAWMDDAGALKVGPRSAGADPGPAAYANGGTEATITDANICCIGSTRQRCSAAAEIDEQAARRRSTSGSPARWGFRSRRRRKG